jgi:hypothetical protein
VGSNFHLQWADDSSKQRAAGRFAVAVVTYASKLQVAVLAGILQSRFLILIEAG